MIILALKEMVANRDSHGGSSFSGLLDVVPLYESLNPEAKQDVIYVLKEWLVGNDLKQIEVAAAMCSRTAISEVKEDLLALLKREVITSNRWILSDLIEGLGNLRSVDLLPLFREYAERISAENDMSFCGAVAVLAIAKLDLNSALPYLREALRRDQRFQDTAPNLFRGQGLSCFLVKGFLEVYRETAVPLIAQTIAQGGWEDITFTLQLLDGAIGEDSRVLSLQETVQMGKSPPHVPQRFVMQLSNELDLLQKVRESLQQAKMGK